MENYDSSSQNVETQKQIKHDLNVPDGSNMDGNVDDILHENDKVSMVETCTSTSLTQNGQNSNNTSLILDNQNTITTDVVTSNYITPTGDYSQTSSPHSNDFTTIKSEDNYNGVITKDEPVNPDLLFSSNNMNFETTQASIVQSGVLSSDDMSIANSSGLIDYSQVDKKPIYPLHDSSAQLDLSTKSIMESSGILASQMSGQSEHQLSRMVVNTSNNNIVDGSRLTLANSQDSGSDFDLSERLHFTSSAQQDILKETQYTSVPVVQQSSMSNNSFIIPQSSGQFDLNSLKSNQQVFLQQGNQLVAVSLPSSTHNGSQQFAILPSSGQQIIQNQVSPSQTNITPTKIIIQTNKKPPVTNPPVTSGGHYVIQVGSNPPIQRNTNTTSNRNHIVIRSNSKTIPPSQIKTEPLTNSPSTSRGGVFKVIIPEGSTKRQYNTPGPQSSEDGIRKHVQINLQKPVKQMYHDSHKMVQWDTGVQTQSYQGDDDEYEVNTSRSSKKLYECSICSAKFMKAFYLRMHARSCKKPEVKREKTPLFMCSYCKSTFKTKAQINLHFTSCFHNPVKDKAGGVKRKGDEIDESTSKRGRHAEIDPSLEQAVQFKCQDCDRTFNKERQFSSHLRRCTKTSFHDLSGARQEVDEESREEDPELHEDPFADPMPPPPPTRRGRSSGRRGRPPGRSASSQIRQPKPDSTNLFEGDVVTPSSSGLLVADNEGIVRSTTGLAHTVQLSLEAAAQDGQPVPGALVAGPKGVRGREKPPQAWSLVCTLCQKMFMTKPALAHHMMSEHGSDLITTRDIRMAWTKDNQPLYKCPLCQLHYSSSEPFIEHMVLQHTIKLQETYTSLQTQTASFVCSLCSLVLLTRNLLIEHLSITHLEELESLAQSQSHVSIESTKKFVSNTIKGNGMNPSNSMVKSEEEVLECDFCGEDLHSQEELIKHYTEVHEVETDEDGSLLDLGIDVDIKVKDTKNLLQLADVRGDLNVPEKTVLIRKKPKQSWQCKDCQLVFPLRFEWLRHVREGCPNSDQDKVPVVTENNFRCQEPNCSHLTFFQVKSLFKHMEEEHGVVVPRQKKSFKNLSQFYQWLHQEEKKFNVRYIRDNSKVEKNNLKLIQMVCHRYHASKFDSSSDDGLQGKNKKRGFVRIQRSSDCHARIHLRVQFNPTSGDYDGETQMVYYPQHNHEEDDNLDLTEHVLERPNREKVVFYPNNPTKKAKIITKDGQVTADIITPGQQMVMNNDNVVELPKGGAIISQFMNEFCQKELDAGISNSAVFVSVPESGTKNIMTDSGLVIQRSEPTVVTQNSLVSNHTVLMEDNRGESVLVDGSQKVLMESGQGKTVLVDNSHGGTFIEQEVINMELPGTENMGEEREEYVLPADEAEWTKLFEVLKNRLDSGELDGQELAEAETLKSCQVMLSFMSLPDQVGIFQKLCALTNTAFESAE